MSERTKEPKELRGQVSYNEVVCQGVATGYVRATVIEGNFRPIFDHFSLYRRRLGQGEGELKVEKNIFIVCDPVVAELMGLQALIEAEGKEVKRVSVQEAQDVIDARRNYMKRIATVSV